MKINARNKVKFRKSGTNSYCSDIALPAKWLKQEGIKIPSELWLSLVYDTDKHTITVYLDNI